MITFTSGSVRNNRTSDNIQIVKVEGNDGENITPRQISLDIESRFNVTSVQQNKKKQMGSFLKMLSEREEERRQRRRLTSMDVVV